MIASRFVWDAGSGVPHGKPQNGCVLIGGLQFDTRLDRTFVRKLDRIAQQIQ
jgi:hypothetical protein